MKIDRVIFIWDGHPRYDGFFARQVPLWHRLGIRPTLVTVGPGEKFHCLSDLSDLSDQSNIFDHFHITDTSTAPSDPPPDRNWKPTMALIHAPRLFPGEVVMVSGLDQFPASRMFVDAVAKVPDDHLVTCYGNLGHIPTAHIVAHHRTWSRIMAPVPADFSELIDWTWSLGLPWEKYNIATGWGCDELLFSCLAQQCHGLTLRTMEGEFFTGWLGRVLGITQIVPDPAKLRSGYYSELHVRLPWSALDLQIYDTLLSTDILSAPSEP